MKHSLWAASLILACLAFSSWSKESKGDAFTLEIVSNAKATMPGGLVMNLEGKTELYYRRKTEGQVVGLFDSGSSIVLKMDGGAVRESFMTRDRLYIKTPEGVRDTWVKDLDEPLKSNYRARFDLPFASAKLDSDGAEVSRELSKEIHAQIPVEGGQIDNFQLFHGKYLNNEATWEEGHAISVGSQGAARGILKYEKVAADKDGHGLIIVKVSGKLINPRSPMAPGIELSVTHDISGEQTYDTAKRMYVGGKWDIKLSSTQLDKDNGASMSGAMVLRLKEGGPPQEYLEKK
ncbi:MAG: hypothetical protein M5U26_00205 [Planctomycetota bacterium]|nr:hypothetical protein [Planctomycetota bacterium]